MTIPSNKQQTTERTLEEKIQQTKNHLGKRYQHSLGTTCCRRGKPKGRRKGGPSPWSNPARHESKATSLVVMAVEVV
jgi:hypothetical protein